VAAQRPERIVVKTDRGCNPACCGCHCALPVLLVPALTLSAWAHALVARQDIGGSQHSDSRVGDGSGWLSRFAIRFIESYRRRVSGRLGVQCRFEPSCSAYALEAYCRLGFVKATRATVSRILRCNPLNRGPSADPL
jgi:putative membrane protein insertion efficiency factor